MSEIFDLNPQQKIDPSQMPEGHISIDIDDTDPIVCPNCGHDTFREVLKLRKLSPILSPTGKPAIIPIQILVCDNCGQVITPEDLSKENEE